MVLLDKLAFKLSVWSCLVCTYNHVVHGYKKASSVTSSIPSLSVLNILPMMVMGGRPCHRCQLG